MLRILSLFPALIAAVLLLASGCSPKYNQSLLNRDLSSLGPIKVVRHETPGIIKASGAETGLLALATLAVPGGSALLFVGDEYGKARGAGTHNAVPDFGSVVMEKFLETVRQAVPHCPELSPLKDPLREDFSESAPVIEFDVKRLAYGSIDLTRGGIVIERGMDKGVIVDGFLSKTVVTMKDMQGEVLWQKSYVYLSKDHDRGMSLEELEADNYCLLKEEMVFAAEQTVADFISHMRGAP
ncbi:MAG: hypothetical protein HZA17_09385 [Nitrospirae bacterium]|nr:hypothetical protein [Nitrospirota bacterium]